MDKTDIIQFFDRLAPTWDSELIRDDAVIGAILDCGGISGGKRVLDVACGTGVLFQDYLDRNVSRVVGVDLSPEMIRIASGKLHDSRFCNSGIEVICADVQELDFKEKFDCIMIYNAFPHFPDPAGLFSHLAGYLAPKGRITVAHGMSREKIDAHHKGSAGKVSVGLMHEDELARLMGQWFFVDQKISDKEKYVVSGVAFRGQDGHYGKGSEAREGNYY